MERPPVRQKAGDKMIPKELQIAKRKTQKLGGKGCSYMESQDFVRQNEI
jgi:hypothetical protein